jgi:hypothetical protein
VKIDLREAQTLLCGQRSHRFYPSDPAESGLRGNVFCILRESLSSGFLPGSTNYWTSFGPTARGCSFSCKMPSLRATSV